MCCLCGAGAGSEGWGGLGVSWSTGLAFGFLDRCNAWISLCDMILGGYWLFLLSASAETVAVVTGDHSSNDFGSFLAAWKWSSDEWMMKTARSRSAGLLITGWFTGLNQPLSVITLKLLVKHESVYWSVAVDNKFIFLGLDALQHVSSLESRTFIYSSLLVLSDSFGLISTNTVNSSLTPRVTYFLLRLLRASR